MDTPDKAKIINIIFDADDTLWAVEELYDHARTHVVKELVGMGLGADSDLEELAKNIDEAKYQALPDNDKVSPARFPQSMVDTYQTAAKNTGVSIDDHVAEKIRQIGESVFDNQARNYPDTVEALEALKRSNCKLYLWTQGVQEIQGKRIENSGLAHYFEKEIGYPTKKTVPVLKRQLEQWGIKPENTWMVGNSVTSDIQPAIDAGLKAIWIPAYSWRPDSKPPHVSSDGRVYVVDSLKYLPEIILPRDNRVNIEEEMKTGTMAYLFVSAYHDLYRQYVLDILAHPRGFVFKFPYDIQWLPHPYRENPETFCANVVGKPALVVFSEERAEGEPRRPQKFVPIRFVQIEKQPHVDGGTIHIEFILGDYVRYENDAKKSLDQYNAEIQTLVARPQLSRADSAYFSFARALPSIKGVADPNQDDNAWQQIVTILSALREYLPLKKEKDEKGNPPDRSLPSYPNPFADVMFFRVQSLKKLNTPLIEQLQAGLAQRLGRQREIEAHREVPIRIVLENDSGYELESSTNYRLSLLFRVAQRPSPTVRRSKIIANLPKDMLTGVGSTEILLNFRYDLRHIDFVTARVYDNTWCSLSLQMVSPSSDKEPGKINEQVVAGAPAPLFLIKIKADRFAQIGAPILFGISSAIASLNTVGAQLLTGATKDHTPQELLISLIMGFAGSLGTTLTLYYLYRKLR